MGQPDLIFVLIYSDFQLQIAQFTNNLIFLRLETGTKRDQLGSFTRLARTW